MITLKSWLLKSISRQISALLIIILSSALLLPAFYFYYVQKAELKNSTEQLARQLISSLRTSAAKSIFYEDHFAVWQLIKNQIKNNQQQIKAGGLFIIDEISILDKNKHVFAHSEPETHPLQKPYTSSILSEQVLPVESDDIIIKQLSQTRHTKIRLYANVFYQGNNSGLIILQLDLTLLDDLNNQLISKFSIYFILILFLALALGILFSRWISTPLEIIEKSLDNIGSGKLQINELHQRHDEYQRLASTLEKTDKSLFASNSKIDALLNLTKEREEYLSIMLHSIGDAVIATDDEGRITRMNPVAEQLTGWEYNDALGEMVKDVFPIIDSSTRESIENPIEKVLNTGQTVYLSNHTTLIAKDGTEYHIADSAAPIRDSHNKIHGMILVFNDVTEQYKLRAKVNDEQKKIQRVFDDMQSLVAILDTDGMLTFINNTPLKLIDSQRSDVLNKKLWDLSFFEHDELIRQTVKNDCLNASNGIITFNDITLNTPDGLFWIEFSVHPVVDDNGNIIQLVAEGRDINQRKLQEEALRRTQKMDAIGQLAGGIAHDFNNQLGVIIGNLDIIKDTLSNEKQLKWIDNSTRATLRCIDLTRQLLTFSRRKSTEKSIVNVNGILNELQTMIARTVTPEVEVEYSLDVNLWPTEIDSGEFQDAILNLVINARDAMPDGGKLIFETSNNTLDENFANNTLNIKNGDYIQITISDTGSGMDNQTLEHIFEPFFTTKPEGKGTGLGLAMVYGFVNRFKGSIRFYSEVNIGTTIRMYLPRSQSTVNGELDQKDSPTLPTGSERVLIVDDEKDLLELANLYLSALGYQVEIAESADQALEILLKDNTFDLVFSDIVMPGKMNGYDLANKIGELWPDMKILLTSGFTSKAVRTDRPGPYDKELLSKPYRKYDLAKRVRDTLDRAS